MKEDRSSTVQEQGEDYRSTASSPPHGDWALDLFQGERLKVDYLCSIDKEMNSR